MKKLCILLFPLMLAAQQSAEISQPPQIPPPDPGPCTGSVIFSDDFDSGPLIWTVTSTDPNALVTWKRDALPALAPVGWDGPAYSSPNSFNYNNDQNYSTGNTANSGQADSPVIDTTGFSSRTFHFKCRYETEDMGISRDQRWFWVFENGAIVAVGQCNSANQPCGPMGLWHDHNVAIPETAGPNLNIRFFFATIDAQNNNHQGWFIDDVELCGDNGATGGGGPPDKENDNGDGNFLRSICGAGPSGPALPILILGTLLLAGALLSRRFA